MKKQEETLTKKTRNDKEQIEKRMLEKENEAKQGTENVPLNNFF